MAEFFSFKEGVALGGPLLHEETDISFSYRCVLYSAKATFYGFFLILIPTLYICLILPNIEQTEPITYPILAFFIFGTFLFGMGLYFNIKERSKISRCRIYQNGFSIGTGEKPFVPFKDIYYIEEGKSVKGASNFTMMTYNDGMFSAFSDYPFMSNTRLFLEDEEYRKVRDLLIGLLRPTFRSKVPWAPEALEFLMTNSHVTGPLKLASENIAEKTNIKQIDIDFIAAHWNEIAAAAPMLSYKFQKASKAIFGIKVN